MLMRGGARALDTPTMRSRNGTRLAIGLVCVVALFVCVVLIFISALATALFTCGGDGGYAYSAPASPAGRWCEGIGASAGYELVQLALPLLVFLVAATYAVVKVRWGGVVIGVLASATVTGVMYVVPSSLSGECSAEQLRTAGPEECEDG
ncbi:hypothetical protein [Nocardioides lijunqiniae]|uniref:hypothetical protein n=1 Tax=Nocardioides lijunqiniae TaxID=2760832 RepID=UPI001877A4CA|nr:hypothetical protein [Nocardioides lijunqiniae]